VTDTVPMRIGDRRVTTADESVVVSPYDGHEVGRVPRARPSDIDEAVAAARNRLRGDQVPAHERARVLDCAAATLAERRDDFARLIADEAAKPVTTARAEVDRACDTFRFSAAVARTFTGETVPIDASTAGVGKVAFVTRHPIGVVAGISPFNFPLNLVAHKVAPAIAVGAPLVLKPASSTPLTALALASLLLDECGLEPGSLNVVTVGGAATDHLVDHADVAMITFTGSPDVGWGIRSRAPKKKVSLELGNNSPVIVAEDGDWSRAAAKIGVGGYSYAGQSCISVQRVFVHESIREEFLEHLVERVDALRVGDPLDDATDVSALINENETARVHHLIEDAVSGGGRVVAGGRIDDGILVPTVVDGVTPDMDLCRTEAFGPVVGVQSYRDFDEAVGWANDTRYGLQAAVFTADLSRALEAARRLEFGAVLINEVPTWRADHMPYGGVRDSGNTREGPAYTAQEMTESRLVVLDP
jgi:acyl-CoA reductase-like NAD-dependent aldehyde dehydrogenase